MSDEPRPLHSISKDNPSHKVYMAMDQIFCGIAAIVGPELFMSGTMATIGRQSAMLSDQDFEGNCENLLKILRGNRLLAQKEMSQRAGVKNM